MPDKRRIDLNIPKVENPLPTEEEFPQPVAGEDLEAHRERIKQQLISQIGAQTFKEIIDLDNPVELKIKTEEEDGKYKVSVEAWEVYNCTVCGKRATQRGASGNCYCEEHWREVTGQ